MTRHPEERIKNMVEVIKDEVRYTRSYLGKDKLSDKVIEAMLRVPRHEFVPRDYQLMAYMDGPVSIGYGQTISQPYIVAIMTDLLSPEADDIILEIGTGSGYQAAILAQLVQQVYTTETVSQLVQPARDRLKRLGYDNIEIIETDGYYGLADHSPYDGIIVTAAAPHIPQSLIDQLKPTARLVIPVDYNGYGQKLKVIEKNEDGTITEQDILDVAFVPLTGNGHDQPYQSSQPC